MSGSVNINTTGSATTTIGNANSTTYINKIDTLTPTTAISLYPSITTGDITIAKNTRGSIIIADGATAGTDNFIIVGTSTVSKIYLRGTALNINDQGNGITNIIGTVNIGNTGLPAAGSVNIAAGGNGAGAIAQLGSNSLDTLYLRGKTVYFNDNVTNGSINIGNPLTMYYSYNNNLNTLGATLSIYYIVGAATAGYATTKCYCCGSAVPVGTYLCFIGIRGYNLNYASPFVFAVMRFSDRLQTNNTVPTGLENGATAGEYYSNVYCPNTGGGYALQPVGFLSSTTTYKFPYMTYYSDADTQSVALSLNLIRVS
jgi:hypothetical protein